MMNRTPHASRTGFSLVEMVLSLSLVGLVLASLGSVLAFSMGAAPKPDDPASQLTNASLPLSVMAEEIGAASSFISIAPQKIVFRIADRTGDSVADTIAYSWDGAPESPLLRTINSDTPAAVLHNIETLSFGATTSQYNYDTLLAGSESKLEQELSADSAPLGRVTALLNSRMQPIRFNQGFAQRMKSDAVPSDAIYWVPQSVEVQLERNAAPGAVRFEIRTVESGVPTHQAIASRVIRASDLGSENWVAIDIPGSLRMHPNTQLCVAIICIEGNRSVSARVFEQLLFPSESATLESLDGGDSWSKGLTTRLSYRLTGFYVGEAKRDSAVETVVETVRFEVNPGSTTQTIITSDIDLPAPVRIAP